MMKSSTIGSALKRCAPTILSCVSIIGVIGTAVTSAKAAPKANALIEAKECEKGTKLTRLETFQTTWKTYAPTAMLVLATGGCIFASNYLNKRNQATMAAAYAALDQTFKQYRHAATEVYGPDADLKIRAEMAKESYIHDDWGNYTYLQEFDDDGTLHTFYEMTTKQYFTSTFGAVLNAQYHLNRNLQIGGDVTLNEYLEFLGIEKVAGGDSFGWGANYFLEDMGIYPWIDFENSYAKVEDSPDGMECFIITPFYAPVRWNDDYETFGACGDRETPEVYSHEVSCV